MKKQHIKLFILLIGLMFLSLIQSDTLSITNPITLSPAQAAPLVASHFGHLPLSFVPNRGQSASPVRFEARGMGGQLFFTPDEVVLSLPAGEQRPVSDNYWTEMPRSVVRLRFAGANPSPTVRPAERLPGTVNYLLGDNPSHWQTNLPTYGGVIYNQLYPGIDLRYDGTMGTLKGTYTVAPGADPTLIRWRYEGVTSIQLAETSGDLLIELPAPARIQRSEGATRQGIASQSLAAVSPLQSQITERAPVAWQEIKGQRVSVKVGYIFFNDSDEPIQNPKSKIQNPLVGFAVGDYDPAYPLIIDPILEWSTYLGGAGLDTGYDITLDGAGDVYLTGTTSSTDFPITTDSYDPSYNGGNSDVFITKLSGDGQTLLYSTYLGGSSQDEGKEIVVDEAHAVYIAGATWSSNFPTTGNALDKTLSGSLDAFVVKLNAAGNNLMYSTYVGGNNGDYSNALAVDSAGNAYVGGFTHGSFPITSGAAQTTFGGSNDGFLAKLNPAGSDLLYSTYLGGSSWEAIDGVAVDAAGNAYVATHTHSPDFPTTPGAWDTVCDNCSSNVSTDAAVAKLSADGSTLIYSTLVGGAATPGGEAFADIAIDEIGQAYLVGTTQSDDFPVTANAWQATFEGGESDIVVTKLDVDGSQLLYSTYLGGSGLDTGTGIALDSTGTVYITGYTTSADFPTNNPLQASNQGGYDSFLAQLDPNNGLLLNSTYLGGDGDDLSRSIAIDPASNVYLIGGTSSTNFPTVDPIQATSGGSGDLFITKISSDPSSSITLIKQANQDATFHFTGDLGDFSLPTAGSKQFTNLSPGSYTITESGTPGWSLVGVQCTIDGPDSPDYSFNSSAQSVTIQLMANQDVTCTLTNEQPTFEPASYRLYLPLIFKTGEIK